MNYFKLIISILVALLLAPSTAPAQGKTLTTFAESTTRTCPEWITLERDPPSPATQTGWASPKYSCVQVGPLNLQAGDIIDARLTHELDNENPGNSAYYLHGLQHEYGWAMASTAVRVAATVDPNAGSYVIQPQEQNWDWRVHHLGVNRSAYYQVTTACAACYVYDRVYGLAGTYVASYDPAPLPSWTYRRFQVNAVPYLRLQVAVFR